MGIVGFDGHGPVFAGVVDGEHPQLQDARVVAAMPYPSAMILNEELCAMMQ
jgi:hypothetical protein